MAIARPWPDERCPPSSPLSGHVWRLAPLRAVLSVGIALYDWDKVGAVRLRAVRPRLCHRRWLSTPDQDAMLFLLALLPVSGVILVWPSLRIPAPIRIHRARELSPLPRAAEYRLCRHPRARLSGSSRLPPHRPCRRSGRGACCNLHFSVEEQARAPLSASFRSAQFRDVVARGPSQEAVRVHVDVSRTSPSGRGLRKPEAEISLEVGFAGRLDQ